MNERKTNERCLYSSQAYILWKWGYNYYVHIILCYKFIVPRVNFVTLVNQLMKLANK